MDANAVERVLAIDVGAGTQDILVYDAARTPENCFKLVLPSQTQIVASRIRSVTEARRPLHLSGRLMGGGASSEAVRAHVEAGLPASATPAAAAMIHNDPLRVASFGVVITEARPENAIVVETGDVDLKGLRSFLHSVGVSMPGTIAIAAQDHGYRPGTGNNEVRFEYLQSLLDAGGDLTRMVFSAAPPGMTRMAALLDTIERGIVMDTGAAAVVGALGDPIVRERSVTDGVILVNVGNMHTFATLLKDRRIYGLFELHTGGITAEVIAQLVRRLRNGELDADTFVAEFDGHGASIHPDYKRIGPFQFVAITGPNRHIARSLHYHEAAPFGDMMMTGAFGLVEGLLMTSTPPATLFR